MMISLLQFKTTERFIIVLYNRVNTHENVNEGRREMFCQKSWRLENIPLTQDALYLHIMKAVLQTGIWWKSCNPNPEIPTPNSWGWESISREWVPNWMSYPEAAETCFKLIRCKCKKVCRRWKYFNIDLPCTKLCQCSCNK